MAIPPYSSYYNKNALVCNEKSNTFDTEILESDQINMIRKVPFFQISVNIANLYAYQIVNQLIKLDI